ncbi:TonB-dependent receptor [Phenylobacterium sp.]|uniref:TonB-dependent receptor n=1 Tax=Phenylobacterium sp. TaxID=1871053 RepID=UPI00374DBFF9
MTNHRLTTSSRNMGGLRSLLLATAALIGGAHAGAAYAADAAASATATVDEVTVTARFREESISKVPIAVSVVSGDQIAAKNLNNLQDLAAAVPSVEFRPGASNKDRTVFIRGLGTITTSPGVEPSVSTVLDGVVLARPGQSTLDLVDVERIEVLRGPQGTLFGKNASAGVVNIVSKNPTDEVHGYLDASYFTGQEYRLKGSISGAIIKDKLEGSLSILGAHFDGNVNDVLRHSKVNGYDRSGVRLKFVANPIDKLKLTLTVDSSQSKDDTPNGVFISTQRIAYPTGVVTPNAALAALLSSYGINTPNGNNKDVVAGVGTFVKDRNAGFGLQSDYTAGDYTLTAITGYRTWKNHQIQDFDALPIPTATFPEARDDGVVDFIQRSQEYRITSPKGERFDFVAGLYYMEAQTKEIYRRNLTRIVAGAPVNDSGLAHYGTDGKNYAAYGEANFNFTKDLHMILGGRAIRDDLSYYHDRLATTLVAVTGIRPEHHSAGSTKKDGWSGRVGLQYDLSDHQMIYVTVSRGYKGPAYNAFFNMQPTDEISLNPETSKAIEIGIKGSAFDGLLSGSLAIYDERYDNYQANFTDQTGNPPALVTRLINAGKVSSKGIEGDITVRPARDVRVSLSFTNSDAKVDTFNCPAGAPVSCNINGEPLPFAPKSKVYVDAQYTSHLIDNYDLRFSTDYSYQSLTQFSLSQTPDTVQKPYGIWNGSVALVGLNNGWTVRGIVKNIANQHYSSAVGYGALAGVVRFVPRDNDRYAGVIVRKDF